MNREELAVCLEAGFIDFNIDEKTNERFLPKILTNNQKQQVKVLESLLSELKNCDEFFFSVAFVTNSGIACLADALNELQNKNIKGGFNRPKYSQPFLFKLIGLTTSQLVALLELLIQRSQLRHSKSPLRGVSLLLLI